MPPPDKFLPNDVELSNTIRRRWLDITQWLKSLIYSEMLDLGNLDAIKKRLAQTSDDADLFYTLYYGPEVGYSIKLIYQNYYAHVQAMVDAYKDNNMALIEQQQILLHKDADELAKLLSRINRYWDEATMQALLYVFVENTEKQIENIVKGNYEDEIKSYDQYVDQAYRISDELTYGMIKQFRIPR